MVEDAECKGYEAIMGQDVQLGTDHGVFHKEKCYSAAQYIRPGSIFSISPFGRSLEDYS